MTIRNIAFSRLSLFSIVLCVTLLKSLLVDVENGKWKLESGFATLWTYNSILLGVIPGPNVEPEVNRCNLLYLCRGVLHVES